MVRQILQRLRGRCCNPSVYKNKQFVKRIWAHEDGPICFETLVHYKKCHQDYVHCLYILVQSSSWILPTVARGIFFVVCGPCCTKFLSDGERSRSLCFTPKKLFARAHRVRRSRLFFIVEIWFAMTALCFSCIEKLNSSPSVRWGKMRVMSARKYVFVSKQPSEETSCVCLRGMFLKASSSPLCLWKMFVRDDVPRTLGRNFSSMTKSLKHKRHTRIMKGMYTFRTRLPRPHFSQPCRYIRAHSLRAIPFARMVSTFGRISSSR